MKRFQGTIATILITAFLISTVSISFGQSINALGEIRSSGQVFVGSSNGSWIPAKSTYPLLDSTKIRTGNGTASLYFSDGSRADISGESLATVSGSTAAYAVTLGKGVMAFNMTNTSTLSIQTPAAQVAVNARTSPVQKVSVEKERVLGAIAVSEKGTEVRSITGKITVSVPTGATHLVSTGESVFINMDGTARVYKTQAVAQGDDDDKKKAGVYWLSGDTGIAVGILGGIALTTGTIFALGSHGDDNEDGKFASPSGFTVIRHKPAIK